jgi:4-oxalocrotonate tautomerase
VPYVKIELLAGRSEEQKAAVAKAVTDALVELAGAQPDSIFIVFDDVAPANWASGGQLLSRKNSRAASSPPRKP